MIDRQWISVFHSFLCFDLLSYLYLVLIFGYCCCFQQHLVVCWAYARATSSSCAVSDWTHFLKSESFLTSSVQRRAMTERTRDVSLTTIGHWLCMSRHNECLIASSVKRASIIERSALRRRLASPVTAHRCTSAYEHGIQSRKSGTHPMETIASRMDGSLDISANALMAPQRTSTHSDRPIATRHLRPSNCDSTVTCRSGISGRDGHIIDGLIEAGTLPPGVLLLL